MIENLNHDDLSPPTVTMADQRTMAQLLQVPTEGYEDAIVVPAITADNFELKHGLLTLVQNKQFFRHDKEDPHGHVRYFNKITSTLKFLNIPNKSRISQLSLCFFHFPLKFFPPSKTTNLRNEITNFQQRFDESFNEAWDRFKDLLRPCPHHGFSELHQLDTFYNALNSKDQDSLNSAVGGNFLDKMPHECLVIIESKSKVCYSCNKPVVAKVSTTTSTSGISPDVAELKYMVKALLLDKKSQNQSPAPVKAVEESCAPAYQAPAPQTQGVSKEDFLGYVKANDAVMRNMQTQGTLPSNTIANPRSDLKEITTRSGVSYDGPQIPSPPSSLSKVVENKPEATKDTVNPTNNENTKDVQPQVVQSDSPILTSKPVTSPIFEPAIASVSASKPNPKASIPCPSRKNDERNREKANNQIEKFYQIFKDMSFEISFETHASFCKRQVITKLKPQDLKGPAFELVKVFHPNVIHLQYEMEECHKILTDSVDESIIRHNVSKPLPLGGPPGQVIIQSDFFFNKDLEYLRYGSKVGRLALSISKMKAAYYLNVGLEKMVPDRIHTSEGDRRAVRTHMWILSVVRIKVFSMYGHLVIKQRVEDFQLRIKSYQTQLNLTEPQWDATGFEYKHNFTVIDSPRAVTHRDNYGVHMIMRFNEIHKFSDGTLHQIDEALDYRVKEFKVNRMNSGLNIRFWTRKNVDRSKEFMFAI
nr:reverse transcriptase domain-containing protein [Tanacetum cinerariifolium]